MKMRCSAGLALGLFGILWALAPGAYAGAITFNTALPVSSGEFVFRGQFIDRLRTDETVVPHRQVTVHGLMTALGYGVTSKLTLFVVVPSLDKTLDATTPMGRIRRTTNGLGDTRLFARYTVLQRDFTGASLRVAPFLGVVAPTGHSDARDRYGELPRAFQTGTGAWGELGGMIATYQTLQYEVDTSLSYQANGFHDGYSAGNVAELDASLQYRVLPHELGNGLPHFLYAVIETNLVHTGHNVNNGRIAGNSGGTEWFLDPGIQYVTPRWVLEAIVQLPIVRNPNPGALRDNAIWHLGMRFNF